MDEAISSIDDRMQFLRKALKEGDFHFADTVWDYVKEEKSTDSVTPMVQASLCI